MAQVLPVKKQIMTAEERKRIVQSLNKWTRSYPRSAPKGNIPVRFAGYND